MDVTGTWCRAVRYASTLIRAVFHGFVNDRGEIFRRTATGEWQRLPGSATAVTIATDGHPMDTWQ